ncbi:MAG: DUF177 domain-containing protein [Alphaproteobacteria bacterium]|nr:DUF177 domain-containing protein [Alphaproteobacteria bacterium]
MDAIEFSRPFAIDDIDAVGTEVEIEAGPAERRRLANRFGLAAINRLTASLTMTRAASGIPIRVAGRFRAEVTQRCVVSLESFDSVVENTLEVEFVPAADMPTEVDFDVDDMDPPEALQGTEIDLGELVAQHLAISLDPYPRKQGAQAPAWNSAVGGRPSDVDRPFAILEKLRKNGKGKS